MNFKLLLNCLFLFIISNNSYAKIDTLLVKSEAMHKTVPNVVVTPDTYGKEKLPVIYLLHGAGDTYTGWVSKTKNIEILANTYNVIVVCPDGGRTSWYFDSPIDKNMQYETYVSKELVNAVDSKYNTIKDKSGRAITGLSMGGHGAFYLAFKHQDIWGAAGSMSGGLDIRPFPNNWDIAKRLGSYAENKNVWEENTIVNMTHLLDGKSLKLVFECGTHDFFYPANKKLHEILLYRNIPHDYTERPGRHNWNYWGNAVKYQFLYFNDFFKS